MTDADELKRFTGQVEQHLFYQHVDDFDSHTTCLQDCRKPWGILCG